MSNPTSNFGWQMPTPTDLVTSLPADFEVFGQAVDSSMADLKGGTSGQILSKNSNTDMDFVWITNDQGDITGVTAGTGISGGGTSGTVTVTNSMATAIDAKGDLIAGTGADAFSRLAAGANGETLVADSSTATGLRYTAGTVQSNPFLNSAFQVWQRGTSIAQTASNMYSADRWNSNRDGFDVGSTVSRQATGDTTNLPFIQYAARVQRNSGTTATTGIYFSQSIESINSIPFAGKTVTLSFYARAGANYSTASNALLVVANSGTGTDQNVLGTWTGAASFIGGNQTATLTTTWQRFTYTGSVAAAATQLGIYFKSTPTGTAGANDWYEVTGVQLDIGSVALPFRTYAGTIQGELAACQRYYYRATAAAIGERLGVGYAGTTTTANIIYPLPVTMRVNPTAIETTGTAGDYSIATAGGNVTCTTTPAFGVANSWQILFQANVASGLTAGQAIGMRFAAANAYVGVTAEL